MKILIMLFMLCIVIIGVVLYVLFSAPKPVYDKRRAQGRDRLLFRSSLKPDNYLSTKKVFETLEGARSR